MCFYEPLVTVTVTGSFDILWFLLIRNKDTLLYRLEHHRGNSIFVAWTKRVVAVHLCRKWKKRSEHGGLYAIRVMWCCFLMLFCLTVCRTVGFVLEHDSHQSQTCWLSKLLRYYALNTAGIQLPPLTWLRYSTFLLLYPAGVSGGHEGRSCGVC